MHAINGAELGEGEAVAQTRREQGQVHLPAGWK